ncbi:MAG: hypothetical protein ACREFP_11120 [Acetobacteraceae bacterium]
MTAEVIPFPRRFRTPTPAPVDLLCRDVLGPRVINMRDLVREIEDLCGRLGLIDPLKVPGRPKPERRRPRREPDPAA